MSRHDDVTTTMSPPARKQLEHPCVARALLFGYTGFAILAAIYLGSGPHRGFSRAAGVAFFLVASLVSLTLGLLVSRGDGLRRVIIGFESLLVPLQVALSVLSDVALIGALLSIAVLALLRPTFPKLSPRLRKFFLTLHVGTSVGWLGASMGMVVLSVTGLVTRNPELRHHAYAFMHIFDLTIVIPLVVLSIVTGLVVSFGTPWGLIRYWWVLVKFVLALGIVAFAGVRENFWVRGLVARTAEDRGADLGGVDFWLTVCMVAFCVALWTATTLSIYKPWGKTKWGRSSPARSLTAHQVGRKALHDNGIGHP